MHLCCATNTAVPSRIRGRAFLESLEGPIPASEDEQPSGPPWSIVTGSPQKQRHFDWLVDNTLAAQSVPVWVKRGGPSESGHAEALLSTPATHRVRMELFQSD